MLVRVAQLDRASGYGPEGREFESCHVHKPYMICKAFFVTKQYINATYCKQTV